MLIIDDKTQYYNNNNKMSLQSTFSNLKKRPRSCLTLENCKLSFFFFLFFLFWNYKINFIGNLHFLIVVKKEREREKENLQIILNLIHKKRDNFRILWSTSFFFFSFFNFYFWCFCFLFCFCFFLIIYFLLNS